MLSLLPFQSSSLNLLALNCAAATCLSSSASWSWCSTLQPATAGMLMAPAGTSLLRCLTYGVRGRRSACVDIGMNAMDGWQCKCRPSSGLGDITQCTSMPDP